MIEVILHKTTFNNLVAFKIKGHTTNADRVKICAGVSMLSEHTLNSLKEIAQAGKFMVVERDFGLTEFYFLKKPTAGVMEISKIILNCFEASILKMQETYPLDIKVTSHEHKGTTY